MSTKCRLYRRGEEAAEGAVSIGATVAGRGFDRGGRGTALRDACLPAHIVNCWRRRRTERIRQRQRQRINVSSSLLLQPYGTPKPKHTHTHTHIYTTHTHIHPYPRICLKAVNTMFGL